LIKKENMYFFSEVDPNYRIKGSRDPLGFQTLWAAAGHGAVAHLSTVSANLRDFMILAYAKYFYGSRPENRFLKFFLKFEQVCAYARRIHVSSEGFNGVDFVNHKIKNNESFSISLNPSDTLLSNQRTYGIYGKYIRPFRDMGFEKAENFEDIIEGSLQKTDKAAVLKIVNDLLDKESITLNKDQLIPVAELLRKLTPEEKEFYRNYILKVLGENHPQNNLYNLVHKNTQIAEAEFNLHTTIQQIQKQEGISEELNSALENIIQTDKVLLPLNRFFLHLLSQSSWTENQIENDTFLNSMPKPVNYTFSDPVMQELNQILSLDGAQKVDAIVKRNDEVKQGGRSWIKKDKNVYNVVYGENGQRQQELDFDRDYEFTYFISTWLNLYKQIELNKWSNS